MKPTFKIIVVGAGMCVVGGLAIQVGLTVFGAVLLVLGFLAMVVGPMAVDLWN